MSNLSKFELGFNTHAFWLILVILLFAGFAFFIYRRTNPPVSNRLRFILMGFRIFSLALILFILFEPNLSLTWFRFQKPLIAVLVDNSASLRLKDARGDRAATLRKILANPVFNKIDDKNDVKYYRFSAALEEWTNYPDDSLRLDGDGTDIQKSLEQLLEKTADNYLKGIVLLTDGADNLGENPARCTVDLGLPIFPVAIGDPTEPKDVLISKTFTNQITYIRNKVPIEVTIKSAGYSDQRVQVILKQEDQVLETLNLRLGENALEQTVQFQITPETEGVKRFVIEIPPLDDEITTLNNRKEIYIKVLKNRMKALCVSGTPSLDFSFLKRTLTSDENIELSTYTEMKNGTFYEGNFPADQTLKDFDVFILLNYPRRDSEKEILARLLTIIDSQNKSVLVFTGPNLDFQRLKPIAGRFPIQLNTAAVSERNINIILTPEGNSHPIFRLSQDPAENSKFWADLPPVYYPYLNIKTNPATQTLAEIDRQRSGLPSSLPQQPVVVISRITNQKLVVILAHGLWRWQFLLQGLGKEDVVYTPFINKLIRWLVTREESKHVQIQLEKDIFRGGEPIIFKAQVYDEDYHPVDDAEVKVKLSGKKADQELLLSSQGNGRYERTVQVLAGGDYEYAGNAIRNGQVAGADSGKFSVEPFNLEFQQTKMEEELLRKIAANTHGHYFTPADFPELIKYIDFPPKRFIESREWELWNKIALMLVLILTLTIEWYVRKRKGML